MQHTIRTLTESDVTYHVEFIPEDTAPEGHFQSGDAEQDAQTCAEIRDEIDHNELAWCTAIVTARCAGFEEQDILGGISCLEKYTKDGKTARQDFDESHLADMKGEALTGLQEQMQRRLDELLTLCK